MKRSANDRTGAPRTFEKPQGRTEIGASRSSGAPSVRSRRRSVPAFGARPGSVPRRSFGDKPRSFGDKSRSGPPFRKFDFASWEVQVSARLMVLAPIFASESGSRSDDTRPRRSFGPKKPFWGEEVLWRAKSPSATRKPSGRAVNPFGGAYTLLGERKSFGDRKTPLVTASLVSAGLLLAVKAGGGSQVSQESAKPFGDRKIFW